MREIYLDNAATTRVSGKAIEKACILMNETYGNPSSLHEKGYLAQKEIEKARHQIARILNINDEEDLYFTSGGTEANNLAIYGTVNALKKRGNKIITTSIEHSSVYRVFKDLECQGFNVIYLKPDIFGKISDQQICDAIDKNTIFISVMMANNEIGSILPVSKIKNIIERKNSIAVFHVDAVQSFGKIPVNVKEIKPDLLTISAHKVHGPKGIGALYKNKKIRIIPRIIGGEQQNKIRPGTESVPLIGAFGECVSQIDLENNYEHAKRLKEYLIDSLACIKSAQLNSGFDSLAYIVNFSILGIKSETMINFLSSKGIYVSGGSACSKGKRSRVLKNIGLSDERITSALRVSFSKHNTLEDIDELYNAIKEGIDTLAKER